MESEFELTMGLEAQDCGQVWIWKVWLNEGIYAHSKKAYHALVARVDHAVPFPRDRRNPITE